MALDRQERRRIVIDGSNIATEGRTVPSLAQLDEAIRTFLEEYQGFASDDVTVVVDATFGHRIDPSELPAFEQALDHGEVITPPAGAVGRGDGFILRIAEKSGALVLSNDSFQEFHAERPWLFEPGRLIGGKPVPGVGWVFTPRTPVRGVKSRAATTRSRRDGTAETDAAGTDGLKGAAKKKAAKASKAAPSARVVKADRADKADKADKATKGTKSAKATKADKANTGDGGTRADKANRADKTNRANAEGVGADEKPAKTGASSTKTAKTAKMAKVAISAKPTKSKKSAKVGVATEDDTVKAPEAAHAKAAAGKGSKRKGTATKERAAGDSTDTDVSAPAGARATKATKAGKAGKTGKVGNVGKVGKAGKAGTASEATSPTRSAPESRDGQSAGATAEEGASALNDPVTFLNFVANHPVGSTFDGTVVSFTSHGAHIEVDGMLCHVPLRGLADPPPNRARQVLSKGETRPFVLVSLDAARRRAALALPGIGPG